MPCIFWAMYVHPQWPYLGPPLPPPCRRLLQISKPMCCDAMELTKTESRSTADRTIVCFDQTEIHVASTVKNCLCLWAHATSRTLEPAILCHQWHQLCRLPWLWGDRVTFVWSLRVHRSFELNRSCCEQKKPWTVHDQGCLTWHESRWPLTLTKETPDTP